MARPPRNVVPGIPLHIVQRGNNRQSIFFAKRDYIRFLDDLQDAATRYNCNLHAYVLMTNHVHLLVTPNDTVGPPLREWLLLLRIIRRLPVEYLCVQISLPLGAGI
jgi:REP element-mobilizing transposase RayT